MPEQFYPLITEITGALFEPEMRRLNSMLIDLNRDNKEIYRTKVDGFIMNGRRFMPQGVSLTIPVPGQPIRILHQDLQDRGDLYLKDLSEIETDQQLIKHALFNVLQPCENIQEMRDAVPECLLHFRPHWKHYARRQEPGFSVRHDDRKYRQFYTILPKIEMYSAAHLLY